MAIFDVWKTPIIIDDSVAQKENISPGSGPILISQEAGANESHLSGIIGSGSGSWNAIKVPSTHGIANGILVSQSGPPVSHITVGAMGSPSLWGQTIQLDPLIWNHNASTLTPYATSKSKMPKQKPGKSVQEVGTPSQFLKAVKNTFGNIILDLAANNENKVCDKYFGPGSLFPDSLTQDWTIVWDKLKVAPTDLFWLNPPFGKIAPWAKKCAESKARIALLVPASISSKWFADYVYGKAKVYAIHPRLTFVGHSQVYPKDLMLCLYPANFESFEVFNWKQKIG